ncbi:RluA family pseudouridine synthase [Candidatus Falkowbacteria bacterium]|nr:RluA family pseudouridine synthase [Candidatus Falkowbacteria bacterium]
MRMTFKEAEKKRLDVFLAETLGQTRSQIQKIIKSSVVFVNDKQEKANCVLKFGDKIVVNDAGKQPTTNVKSAVSNNLTQPAIIKETADYLVIEKPAGLIVHSAKENEPSVVSWLIKKYPEIAKIADTESLVRDDETFRPGIIHRLDRDVSGLMLIAKTQNAFDFFKEQMRHKKIKKEYIALIHGKLDKSEGEINFEISRKADEPKMAAHPFGSGKGKPSLTTYETIQTFRNFTLVNALPITGRTNQLRVHFFALDHAIVGDKKYANKKDILQNEKLNISRPFLHAAKLTFTDPCGEQQTFESALPADLAAILKSITKRHLPV